MFKIDQTPPFVVVRYARRYLRKYPGKDYEKVIRYVLDRIGEDHWDEWDIQLNAKELERQCQPPEPQEPPSPRYEQLTLF